MKKILFFSCVLFFSLFVVVTTVFADSHDIIIQDNGSVLLIITKIEPVLGETTSAGKENDPGTVTPVPLQTTSLVSPHEKSTVQINPPINDGGKIQIIITSRQAPASPITTKQNDSEKSLPAEHVATSVDKLIAQQSNGQPVITITSGHAHELTIQQGSTKATTTLPLQMDTQTHALSSPVSNQPAIINVLPKEAVEGVVNQGLFDTKGASTAGVTLTSGKTELVYAISMKRQGKIFGVFPVDSSIHVQLSARSGKVINITQPFVTILLKPFIR